MTDEPWRKVKPFREADAPVIRYLTPDECVRLVNACEPAFRNLVRGALVTGCRYGELIRMQVRDFHAEGGTVSVVRGLEPTVKVVCQVWPLSCDQARAIRTATGGGLPPGGPGRLTFGTTIASRAKSHPG